MTHVRAALVVVVVAASACGDAVRAPITIVVDTDRARAREEQGRLLELRAGVQGDRAELTSARVALQQARQRLEEAARGPQREALAAEVKVLEACVQERGDAISRAELAEALAATEQRLLAALAAAPPPPPANVGGAPPTTTSPATSTASQAREILAEARRLVAAKGIALADLDGGAERLDRVEALLGRDDIATAIGVAETLRADAGRVVVDRPVLLRRYQRLNARVVKAGLTGPAKAKAEGLLQAASTAISGGDVAAATAALSTLSADLGG